MSDDVKDAPAAQAPESGGPPSPAAAPVDGLDDQVSLSPMQLVRQVYAFFYNKAFGLILILLAGLLSLLGVLFPQMPSSAKSSPQSADQWLETVRPTFGGWTGFMRAIGFFTMFSSIPFLVVMGLLALSIIACTVHRLPVIWRAARHPRTRVTERFFDRARLRSRFTTSLDVDRAFEVIRADARKRHLRLIVDERGPGRNAYIDRHYWAPFGTVLAHAAFVTIMLGFVVSSVTGFNDQQFTLTIGHPKDVGHGTGLTAEAMGFHDTYYDDGSPKDYAADLVLYEGDRRVAAQKVRVNSPLSYDGVMFHQAYFGVSAVMRVTDSSGAEVFHNGVALEWTTKDKTLTYGRTVLPDGRTLYVIGAASGQTGTGIEPGQVKVELYENEGDRPVEEAVVDMGAPTSLGGYGITFEREQQFTGMIVKKDPGTRIVWLGFLLLATGTCMSMFFRHQRMWVRVTESDEGTLVRIASPDRQDSGFTRYFTDMAVRLGGEMARKNERIDADA